MLAAFSVQTFVSANAREEWERFLEALEDRRYFDVAVDYLETLRNDPNCDPRLIREIPERTLRLKQKETNGSSQDSAANSYKNVNALADSQYPNPNPNAVSDSVQSRSAESSPVVPSKITDFQQAVRQTDELFAAFVKLNNELSTLSSENLSPEQIKRKSDSAIRLEKAIRLALEWSERPETKDAEEKSEKKIVVRDKNQKSLDVQIDDLRFQWAYLALATDQNERAIVLANHLVRSNYSNILSVAEITLQAWKNLYSKIQNDENLSEAEKADLFLFANDRIAEFTDYILSEWGASSDDDKQIFIQKCVLVRINSAISSNNIERARQFLEQIPEDSEWRAVAELRLGLAVWAAWGENEKKKALNDDLVNAVDELPSTNDPAAADDLNGQNNENSDVSVNSGKINDPVDTENATDYSDSTDENISWGEKQAGLLNDARTFLNQGLQRKIRLNNGFQENDYLSIYSALTLAGVYFVQNDSSAAWEWLNHPTIGPYFRIQRLIETLEQENADSLSDVDSDPNAESVQNDSRRRTIPTDFLDEAFQTRTLILALRLFVKDQRFEDAEKTIAQLETYYSQDESELISIYLQMGKELEDQIRRLSDSKETERLAETTAAFESFLDRLSQKSEKNNYWTLRWVGDTFASFGKGTSGSLSEPSPEAQKYFIKAGRTYQSILKKIKDDPSWAGNDDAETAVTIRLSQCLCAVGRQEKAIPLLVAILEKTENVLDVQMEAANVYQSMGRTDNKNYIRAIVGEYKKENGQNLIWGWNGVIYRLSRNLAAKPQLNDLFYEAIVNKMFCRYSYARRLTDENERLKQAKESENELLRLKQTRPDLGGPEWGKKLDDRLKRFRRLQGQENPQGF